MLLSCTQIMDGISEIVDPFCGSGTVLLESQLAHIDSLGIEQNPVAALISKVKTTAIDASALSGPAASILRGAKRSRARHATPTYLATWYTDSARSALARLRAEIFALDSPARDALIVAFLLTARQAANIDRRIPVPVRPRPGNHTTHDGRFVWDEWARQVQRLTALIERLPRDPISVSVRNADSRRPDAWHSNKAPRDRLMFTSPPYGAAQKYIRSTSLELGWLGLASNQGTAHIERNNIGREHVAAGPIDEEALRHIDVRLLPLIKRIQSVDPRRASIYATYFQDMSVVLAHASQQCDRIVMIASTNTVTGETVPTYDILGSIVESNGHRKKISLRDQIRGRSLLTTRRSGHAPAAAEYVEVFERE